MFSCISQWDSSRVSDPSRQRDSKQKKKKKTHALFAKKGKLVKRYEHSATCNYMIIEVHSLFTLFPSKKSLEKQDCERQPDNKMFFLSDSLTLNGNGRAHDWAKQKTVSFAIAKNENNCPCLAVT